MISETGTPSEWVGAVTDNRFPVRGKAIAESNG
jgi:hypothetical protein